MYTYNYIYIKKTKYDSARFLRTRAIIEWAFWLAHVIMIRFVVLLMYAYIYIYIHIYIYIYIYVTAGVEIKTEPLSYCRLRAARIKRSHLDIHIYIYIYLYTNIYTYIDYRLVAIS